MHDPGPPHPELQAGERTTLEQVLDFQRRTVVAKVAGLTDDQAASHPLPATDMTVAGIVNHLAWAEDRWFQGRLLGVPMPEPWASGHDDPDWPFRSAAGEPLDALVARYAEACDRSRSAARSIDDLDTPAAVSSFGKGPVSLRWILVHMIEETARHAGHLDLLRDAIDAPP